MGACCGKPSRIEQDGSRVEAGHQSATSGESQAVNAGNAGNADVHSKDAQRRAFEAAQLRTQPKGGKLSHALNAQKSGHAALRQDVDDRQNEPSQLIYD